jgi:cytochrome c oxidase subunit 1
MGAVAHAPAAAHGHAHADHHHHEESFISKYVFSQDHKMISKQFLVTAIVMAWVAMIMSIIFRCNWPGPGRASPSRNFFLGDKWAPDGVLNPNMYLALVTIHGTIMVFFVLTGGLSGTFANLLIPLQVGARDMASGFLNMLSYWFFLAAACHDLSSFFVEGGPAAGGWTVYPPLSALPQAIPGSGTGMTLWLLSMACSSRVRSGRPELHRHHPEPAHQGHEDDPPAADRLGPAASRPCWACLLPRAAERALLLLIWTA